MLRSRWDTCVMSTVKQILVAPCLPALVDLPLYNKGSYAAKALVAARFSLWLFKPVIDRGVRRYDG